MDDQVRTCLCACVHCVFVCACDCLRKRTGALSMQYAKVLVSGTEYVRAHFLVPALLFTCSALIARFLVSALLFSCSVHPRLILVSIHSTTSRASSWSFLMNKFILACKVLQQSTCGGLVFSDTDPLLQHLCIARSSLTRFCTEQSCTSTAQGGIRRFQESVQNGGRRLVHVCRVD